VVVTEGIPWMRMHGRVGCIAREGACSACATVSCSLLVLCVYSVQGAPRGMASPRAGWHRRLPTPCRCGTAVDRTPALQKSWTNSGDPAVVQTLLAARMLLRPAAAEHAAFASDSRQLCVAPLMTASVSLPLESAEDAPSAPMASVAMPLAIGITGATRSGKGWASTALKVALTNAFALPGGGGGSVEVVGQDAYWQRPVTVTTASGRERPSEEEPDCTDHASFLEAIRDAKQAHRAVIAEGFQLLHHEPVAAELDHIFALEIGFDESKRRRTQERDALLNPNPMSATDFDELVWPAHQRYTRERLSPLVAAGRVTVLPAPENQADVMEIVRVVMAALAGPGHPGDGPPPQGTSLS